MADAFIYDTVRTPRGRGKADGSLHEVTALNLASQALGAIKDRHDLDPALLDDVVMGCVDPVGEAGGDIARVAAIMAGYGDGVPGVQINRFCASGLDAVNFAAAQVMAHDGRIVDAQQVEESHHPVGMTTDGQVGPVWPIAPTVPEQVQHDDPMALGHEGDDAGPEVRGGGEAVNKHHRLTGSAGAGGVVVEPDLTDIDKFTAHGANRRWA